MKEGDYLSAKGPKVWPSCVLSMSDILSVQINWSAMSHDINKQKCPFWKAWSTALMQTGLGNLQRSDLVFHKVSTGCLHCKLGFGNFWKGCMHNLFVESWGVMCRDASVTSPIRSEPLACLLAELALLPCTKYATFPVHHFKNVLDVMEWSLVCFAQVHLWSLPVCPLFNNALRND